MIIFDFLLYFSKSNMIKLLFLVFFFLSTLDSNGCLNEICVYLIILSMAYDISLYFILDEVTFPFIPLHNSILNTCDDGLSWRLLLVD